MTSISGDVHRPHQLLLLLLLLLQTPPQLSLRLFRLSLLSLSHSLPLRLIDHTYGHSCPVLFTMPVCVSECVCVLSVLSVTLFPVAQFTGTTCNHIRVLYHGL